MGKRLGFGDYSFRNRSSSQLPIGKWTHIAVTLTRGEMRFYFNGKLDRVGPQKKTRPMAQNTNPVHIGSDYDGRYFNGDIDEVRVYNRALSGAEIADLYKTES